MPREFFFERVDIRGAAVWTVVRLRRHSPTNRDSSSLLLTKTSDTLLIALLPATFNEQHNPQTFNRRLPSFVGNLEISLPCIHLHYDTL